MDAGAPFGDQLRGWRKARGLSQLELAHRAGTTPRHVSFIETGRSRPGPDLIRRLSACLDLPVRARNALVVAAGLRPAHPPRSLDDRALRPFVDGVRRILDAHSPYPAAAMDELGSVHLANDAYRRLSPGIEDRSPDEIVSLFYGKVGREMVENWAEVAWSTADRRWQRALATGDPEQIRLAERARALLAEVPRPDLQANASLPLVCPRLRIGAEVVETYAAVVRFETAEDVTLSELRVELIYPTTSAGASIFRALAE